MIVFSKNCSMSAAEKCDSTKITGINSSKIEECKTTNKNYMMAFDVRPTANENKTLTIFIVGMSQGTCM